MAEALSEEPTASEPHLGKKTISLLLLATKWQFDTYGLSTINKSLVSDLRLVDPEDETIKITCAIVEEEGKINYVDVKDAGKCGVVLKGAKRPMSKNKHSKPKLSWLDEHARAYYSHLQDQDYDFIIGHVPYLANGCFNLKHLDRGRQMPSQIILMVHGLPKDENGDIDDEILNEWLTEADIVFSIGSSVESELIPYVAEMDEEIRPVHKMYLPSYPVELFHVGQESKGMKIKGTQNVTIMSAEFKDLNITGLDFPLAVNATIGAAEHIRDFDGVRTTLTMLAAHEDDKEMWKVENDKEFKSQNFHRTGLSFKTEVPTDINKLQSYLKRSTLFLLPLKPDSPLFGTEALAAIAAGVPVLISRYSGIAWLLQKMSEDEPIVYGTKLEHPLDKWKERILQKLLRPDQSQRAANRLREQLLLDTSIAQTHLDFINIIAKEACVQLHVDIQSDSGFILPKEHLDAAIKFGVEQIDATDVQKYIVAFVRKLLLQREKLDKEVLKNYLKPAITKQLSEVFSILEDKNRKLINVQNGSVIFTLLCPTKLSRLQLQDENWRIKIQNKMTELLKLLGLTGAEFPLKLQIQDSEEMQHALYLPKDRPLIADWDKRSIGYESMTTVSDVGSELLESEFEVDSWLYQQDTSDTTELSGKDQFTELLNTWTVDHVEPEIGAVIMSNRFTVSESGAVGISCDENPSLSVMYPDKDRPPMILSNEMRYLSATFVKFRGKEHLAAACLEDGCLHLWDIESKTYKKIFDPKLPMDEHLKDMNICKIDESTIGYGEVGASLDGSRRVFILNTNTAADWTLSGTLKFFTPHDIWDMCYAEVVDGSPCLLLCMPHDHSTMAVEMIGGKTRWEVGKEQMGEEFFPWSICTDQNNCAYIADFTQRKIHALSASDGTLTKRFDVDSYYGIVNVFAVRLHGQHLYVEHKAVEGSVQKYAISKFKQINAT